MNKYRGQKIQKTSFLDKAFMKTLAGAVRFGTTLLVENVEKLDPVLNPIVSRDLIVSFSFKCTKYLYTAPIAPLLQLNKEIQRTGGRSLVR